MVVAAEEVVHAEEAATEGNRSVTIADDMDTLRANAEMEVMGEDVDVMTAVEDVVVVAEEEAAANATIVVVTDIMLVIVMEEEEVVAAEEDVTVEGVMTVVVVVDVEGI
ncbi:hypothetical protein ACQ4LE_002365 [Meloidogyne hapla]